ncbi:hypothetical protein GCM10010123_43190 [Pilimelia anulata]|uniref:Methionyl-tRNA formyltransferase n=1 Tax=Pilimelia anulata TaxID=53371 RepID=A0A8J3BJV7_9ACTN|nr:formyltransferase family protein [Pilimelia anulata]GGK08683.1 hypothetical protein GCM10010123_43190 [Pilimelia anulata]
MITAYAMTAKGVAAVTALLDAGLVTAVVGADDAGVADGSHAALRALCADRGIPFADRAAAGPPATPYLVAVGWRWLIDPGPATLVVFHDSLLPRYRGFNPLVTALIEGDDRTGVTALLATDEYDRGDILGRVEVPLPRPIRIADAIALVAAAYGELAAAIGARIAAGGPLAGVPQDEAAASYSLWRDDADYDLDWTGDAVRLRDTVLAVGPPYRGARTLLNGTPVRVYDATVEPDVTIANRTPGKVVFLRAGRPTVVCGTGLLRLDDVRHDEPNAASALPLARFRSRFG